MTKPARGRIMSCVDGWMHMCGSCISVAFHGEVQKYMNCHGTAQLDAQKHLLQGLYSRACKSRFCDTCNSGLTKACVNMWSRMAWPGRRP
eukprot:gene166-biopygen13592